MRWYVPAGHQVKKLRNRYIDHNLPVTPILPPEATSAVGEVEGLAVISNPVRPIRAELSTPKPEPQSPFSSCLSGVDGIDRTTRPLRNININHNKPNNRSTNPKITLPSPYFFLGNKDNTLDLKFIFCQRSQRGMVPAWSRVTGY